jgi:tryptophan synthase alpha chain
MDDESVANICAIQVSTVGVTGTRANVSGKVQSLLQDIKKVCNYTILI